MTTTIEELAKQLGDQLKIHHLKLATAESCTGGGLSYAITSIPGSSAWFDRGFVTYSNTSKEELLSVSPLTLATFGSVSAETAQEMAEGALNHSQAQISIALTGIAGPEGGTPTKPVGTVWIAAATFATPTQVIHHLFSGERASVREESIKSGLRILLNIISSIPQQ